VDDTKGTCAEMEGCGNRTKQGGYVESTLLLNRYRGIRGFNYTIEAQCLGWPVSQRVLEGRKGGSSSQVKEWVVIVEGLTKQDN
jgi:hypothetical protein